MSMYRVIQRGEAYYPQKKLLFIFWATLKEWANDYPVPVRRDSLTQAISAIDKYKQGEHRESYKVVWMDEEYF